MSSRLLRQSGESRSGIAFVVVLFLAATCPVVYISGGLAVLLERLLAPRFANRPDDIFYWAGFAVTFAIAGAISRVWLRRSVTVFALAWSVCLVDYILLKGEMAALWSHQPPTTAVVAMSGILPSTVVALVALASWILADKFVVARQQVGRH